MLDTERARARTLWPARSAAPFQGRRRGWLRLHEFLVIGFALAIDESQGKAASCYGSMANAAASARTSGFMKKVLSCGVTFTRTPRAPSSAATIGPTAASALFALKIALNPAHEKKPRRGHDGASGIDFKPR